MTQNTTWKNVEKSLQNLQNHLTLESFLTLNEEQLKLKIKPSGFYNQKAPRLLQIAQNIQNDFDNIENFKNNVTREWLLKQKGIGKESADSILCYGCFKDIMVVDSYTKRLLKKYGIEFKNYDEYQQSLESGIRANISKDTALIFAQFHGMIVEYSKRYKS